MDRPTLKRPDYSESGTEPYSEGREAHESGLDVSDNPYDPIRQEVPSEEWERGWMDAEKGR